MFDGISYGLGLACICLLVALAIDKLMSWIFKEKR